MIKKNVLRKLQNTSKEIQTKHLLIKTGVNQAEFTIITCYLRGTLTPIKLID